MEANGNRLAAIFFRFGSGRAASLAGPPLLVLLLLAQCDSTADSPRLTGRWGGPGAHVVAEDEHIRFEFDCAHGLVRAPPDPDDSGRFRLQGSLTHERGGPGRLGEPEPRPESAVFEGQVHDGWLTLEVSSHSRHLGPFRLDKDQPATLEKCL